MKLLLWVTALAVLSTTFAIENKPDKSKRQLENIRTPQNLQYSLVLPHSRVSSFRSLGTRRISQNIRPSKLPPYAVQMEPMVQYSQKDPLYDPSLDHLDDGAVNKNEIQAQPKILNINEHGDLRTDDNHISENVYGPPYGSLPTAPLYGHPHRHFYEEPEPIIEIIIKESNETLPAPVQPLPPPVKKEPVQVFYVKYSKDPHHENKVIYEKPVPALTPPSNAEEHHRETYVTVTPEPILPPQPSTTLRTIIKPESEVYHSESGVKVTFGTENKHQHHHDDYTGSEGHEETAPRPAIAYPQQPQQRQQNGPQQHENYQQQQIQYNEQFPKPPTNFGNNYKQVPQHAQSRIQFQQPFLPHEQQLPRQNTPHQSFRSNPSHVSRQGPFGPQSTPAGPPPSFVGRPPHNLAGPINPSFLNGQPNQPGPITQTFSRPPGPTGPTFVNGPPRPQSFPVRPNSAPAFHSRPNQHPPNSPPRSAFHSGPSRPFHSTPQIQNVFNEPKYLQENYHTITTEQVDPPKEQVLQSRPPQNFDFVPRPSPQPSAASISQEEYNKRFFPQFNEQNARPIDIPLSQHLPQQRPPQQFFENKPGSPTRPSFNQPQFQNYRPNQEPSTPTFQHQHQQFNVQPQHFHQHHQRPQNPVEQHQHPQSTVNHQAQNPTPESSHINNRFPGSNVPQPSPQPQFIQPTETVHQQNHFHQQNVGQLVPQGGEIVPGIAKYEQHITVSGPGSTVQPNYSGLSQPTPTPAFSEQQTQQVQQNYYEQEQEQVRLQLAQNVQKQQEEIQRLQSQLLQAQQQQNQQRQEQHHRQQEQQFQQEQQRRQQGQEQQRQEEQQHQYQQQKFAQSFDQNKQYQQNYRFPGSTTQQKQETYKQPYSQKTQKQYTQERSKTSSLYSSSTATPYYQSTSRTVEITPTTQRYVSSTINSINTTPEAKKAEKKKKPTIELPDEVPDDLRQQLLSSGILDNADISILDYDKVGDTPLDSLPPDQLANFFSAGGGQQIAASENRPVVVKPNGDKVYSRIDDLEDDQEGSASENMASVVAPPPQKESDVQMKVVHFDPSTMEGKTIAQEYVKKDATRLEPVALNDKKYNRYLPLKVSGNQFPLPDVLKGRRVTSVVVLAPVETEALNAPEHSRLERATDNKLKGIKFLAGESLQELLKQPSRENFKRWLEKEKTTATDQQSVILLVTGTEDPAMEKEIFMYDPETMNVNKLSGELSSAFVEAADNNSLSRDIEKLAIEGEGTQETLNSSALIGEPIQQDEEKLGDSSTGDEEKGGDSSTGDEEMILEGSDNVPLYVDFASMKLNQDGSKVSISSGYSKTKKGRSFSNDDE